MKKSEAIILPAKVSHINDFSGQVEVPTAATREKGINKGPLNLPSVVISGFVFKVYCSLFLQIVV